MSGMKSASGRTLALQPWRGHFELALDAALQLWFESTLDPRAPRKG
jgi:hypothetical protein